MDDGDTLDKEWLNIPLTRIEGYIELLTKLLIKSHQYDSRSEVGDTLLRIEGQLEQMRQQIPKPH